MKIGFIHGLVVAVGLMAALPAAAADTPASLDGAKLVTAEEVQKLQAAGAVIVDTRVAAEFAEGHLKGAVSIPYREKSAKSADFNAAEDEFALAKLPADKNAAIVTYCNGGSCWKSYKAAVVAIKAGYKNINWFREGFPQWQSKGFAVE
jgi:rhodanese-related sulfurtransferase